MSATKFITEKEAKMVKKIIVVCSIGFVALVLVVGAFYGRSRDKIDEDAGILYREIPEALLEEAEANAAFPGMGSGADPPPGEGLSEAGAAEENLLAGKSFAGMFDDGIEEIFVFGEGDEITVIDRKDGETFLARTGRCRQGPDTIELMYDNEKRAATFPFSIVREDTRTYILFNGIRCDETEIPTDAFQD
jgi:hypothetical protein